MHMNNKQQRIAARKRLMQMGQNERSLTINLVQQTAALSNADIVERMANSGFAISEEFISEIRAELGNHQGSVTGGVV
jgi:hypothetical protein